MIQFFLDKKNIHFAGQIRQVVVVQSRKKERYKKSYSYIINGAYKESLRFMRLQKLFCILNYLGSLIWYHVVMKHDDKYVSESTFDILQVLRISWWFIGIKRK